MKGDRKKSAKSLFKKGNKLYLKRKTRKIEFEEDIEVQYVRPTPEERTLLENQPIDLDSMPRTTASDNRATRTVFLRSCSSGATDSKTDGTDHR